MLLRKFFTRKKSALSIFATALLYIGLLSGCQGTPSEESSSSERQDSAPALTGEIAIDGSSTVYPITSAIAEEFQQEHPAVRITIGFSGTGGGFEKFIAGETLINNASRPIKEKEKTALSEKQIDYIELKVAIDGLSVVINPANDFVDFLTMDELKKMWAPNSTVKTWQDVRNEWPSEPIKFFAPGADSGTFEYFTETVNGEAGAIRTDITASEDDNVLVGGVAGEKGGIGFFGYSYYEENQDKLKIVPIDSGSGAIEPNAQTVQDGSYTPLSRPLFVYVRKDALIKEEVRAFLRYYFHEGTEFIPQVGYVALTSEEYEKLQTLIEP